MIMDGTQGMFTAEQVKLLNEKLPAELVRSRKQGGRDVVYIDGYTVISTANRIFGFGNWEGVILSMDQVELSDVQKTGSSTMGFRVGYTCRYQLRIYSVNRQQMLQFVDIGFGSGTSYTSAGDAIESATKEAATDAMKRCFRMMGSPLGLALYDKEQKEVDDGRFDSEAARRSLLALEQVTVADIRAASTITTREEFTILYKEVKNRTILKTEG